LRRYSVDSAVSIRNCRNEKAGMNGSKLRHEKKKRGQGKRGKREREVLVAPKEGHRSFSRRRAETNASAPTVCGGKRAEYSRVLLGG